MDLPQLLLLALASAGAGAINAAAGGGTLITFPAMLAVGMTPLAANVTSTIGILPGSIGGALSYRREVVAQRSRFWSHVPFAAAGSIVGAIVLLVTPPTSFESIVPWLVLLAAGLFALQQPLTRYVSRRDPDAPFLPDGGATWITRIAFFVAGVYGSYFGAGMGIMMLATLGLVIHDSLQKHNALKNVMALVVNGIGCLIYAFSPHVDWLVVAVMVPCALAGGFAGGWLSRLMPTWVLRLIVICFALGVAGTMLWQQHIG